jgi:acid stress-induced BolA-like protein IbaG/YrbA
MVFNALGDKMKSDIHALSIKTYTLNEWNQLKT